MPLLNAGHHKAIIGILYSLYIVFIIQNAKTKQLEKDQKALRRNALFITEYPVGIRGRSTGGGGAGRAIASPPLSFYLYENLFENYKK